MALPALARSPAALLDGIEKIWDRKDLHPHFDAALCLRHQAHMTAAQRRDVLLVKDRN